jgi:hypothetical protein
VVKFSSHIKQNRAKRNRIKRDLPVLDYLLYYFMLEIKLYKISVNANNTRSIFHHLSVHGVIPAEQFKVSQLSVASETAVMMFRLRNLHVFWKNVLLLLSVCKSLLGMKVVFSSIILKNFAYYTTLNPRRW